MAVAESFTVWTFLEIVSCVVSLHYACYQSMDTFLKDFTFVLSSTHETTNGSSETAWKTNIKETLIEAINIHSAIMR